MFGKRTHILIIQLSFYPAIYHLAVNFLITQGRRDLKAVVYCYGGGACNIELNTATTAGDVSTMYFVSI